MPTPTPSRRRAASTAALFAGALLLASLGIALLVAPRPDSNPAPLPVPASSSSPTHRNTAQGSRPAAPTPAKSASQGPTSQPAAVLRGLPQPIAEAAKRFTVAWASHDARPGKDHDYSDAADRAAAEATADFAARLRGKTGSAGAHRWQQWQTSRARVTANITRITVPDGAPGPTAEVAYARVLYSLTTTPEHGPSTTSPQQVALRLEHGADGRWRAAGMPKA
ncbi:hypothetical protein ACH4U6_34940 [Streptomyces netropsis]|uniref:hypothetical protein n=1 Tax=Streptomyces netropsis TaxID=55404 RepID=UPI0037AA7053